MKPYVAAARVGIHVNTVRTWTLGDYKDFFSVNAQGGDKHTRDLTETDLRILNYIKDLKQKGRRNDEVIASLIEAQRRGFDYLPLPTSEEYVVPTAVIPRSVATEVIESERRVMAERIKSMEERIAGLEQRLEDEKSEREQLISELAEVKFELKMYKAGWRPPINGVGE